MFNIFKDVITLSEGCSQCFVIQAVEPMESSLVFLMLAPFHISCILYMTCRTSSSITFPLLSMEFEHPLLWLFFHLVFCKEVNERRTYTFQKMLLKPMYRSSFMIFHFHVQLKGFHLSNPALLFILSFKLDFSLFQFKLVQLSEFRQRQ